LKLLDILPNSPILVLEASKLGPSLVLSILGIELLLEFPLEFIPSGDGVGSSLEVVTPTTPPNKGCIFKRKGGMVYLLPFICDACRSKVGVLIGPGPDQTGPARTEDRFRGKWWTEYRTGLDRSRTSLLLRSLQKKKDIWHGLPVPLGTTVPCLLT